MNRTTQKDQVVGDINSQSLRIGNRLKVSLENDSNDGIRFQCFNPNIYVFGASLEDTGNMNILGMNLEPSPFDTEICEEIGPLGRFSDGFNYIDFMICKPFC